MLARAGSLSHALAPQFAAERRETSRAASAARSAHGMAIAIGEAMKTRTLKQVETDIATITAEAEKHLTAWRNLRAMPTDSDRQAFERRKKAIVAKLAKLEDERLNAILESV
jgi:hypothetical protein